LFDKLQQLIDEIVWGEPLTKVGPVGSIVATALRYLYAMLRDFFSGQLTMRAMGLVYTTLLSIVPLLAFSFAILKGFGVFNQLEPYLDDLLAPLGPQGERITDQVLSLVDNVKGSVLGGLGLAFFLYTAISMVQKVEEAFNYVWYVSKPRNFARRFTEYLIVLLVGPMAMVTAIGMITSIQSNTVVQYLLNNEALGPIFVVGGKFVPYLLISAVFTFLYMFMPNTKVNFRSALVGGAVGGIMWATMGAIPELAHSIDWCTTRFLSPKSGISAHRPARAQALQLDARAPCARHHVPLQLDARAPCARHHVPGWPGISYS
jgi:membrane protein